MTHRQIYQCWCTHIRRLNGRQRITSHFRINISPTQIIHNDNIVSLITKVERRRPAAESISTKDDNFLLSAPLMSAAVAWSTTEEEEAGAPRAMPEMVVNAAVGAAEAAMVAKMRKKRMVLPSQIIELNISDTDSEIGGAMLSIYRVEQGGTMIDDKNGGWTVY